jgi:hypothetical protein
MSKIIKVLWSIHFGHFSELYQANNDLVLALDYYQTVLSLDAKVGVKRKITQVEKAIST